MAGQHLGWWLAIGLILAFLPYFPYTKHFHLIVSGFNFLTKPERTSLGTLDPINFEDESIEEFGVAAHAAILSFIAVFGTLGARLQVASPWVMVAGVLIGSALWWLLLCAVVARLRTRFDARAMAWVNRASAGALAGFALWQWAALALAPAH